MFATAAICSRRIGIPPSFADASPSASVMERWPGTGGSFGSRSGARHPGGRTDSNCTEVRPPTGTPAAPT
ncbi:hypothetical protein JCM4814A_46770 [Streptomyces phaeofaciens JCM 4814]